jgi:energy-coupling factor transporter ATP-binding protein EcfA2
LHAGQVLTVSPGSLVVLAGLPGAGKTTLLRRLAATGAPGVRSLDAEEVADRLRALGGRLPYRVLRPAVHALHLLRVLRAAHGPSSCVLTTDPMTSPLRRCLLRLVARSSGRALHVVLVDATASQARLGQRARGRTLGSRRMARHVARTGRLRADLDRTGEMSFVDEVLVLPRAAARATATVAVEAAVVSLPQRPARAA